MRTTTSQMTDRQVRIYARGVDYVQADAEECYLMREAFYAMNRGKFAEAVRLRKRAAMFRNAKT